MHLQYISAATQDALVSAPSRAYASAVAIAAAYAVSIPTSIVADLKTQLAGGTQDAITAIVGIFNEVRPLDTAETIALAEQVWQARYEVAHGLMLEHAGDCNTGGVLDLFGIGFCLSGEKASELTQDAAEIMKVLGACIKAARQITVNPA